MNTMNTLADTSVRRRDLYKGIVTLLLLVTIVILWLTRPASVPEVPVEPAPSPSAQAPAFAETRVPQTAAPQTAVPQVAAAAPATAMPTAQPTPISTTPPTAAPTVQPTAAAISPSIQSVRTSATGEVSLDGTGQPGSSLELWSGTTIGTVVVSSDGTWSFSGQLPAGDYQVVARTVDGNGSILQESAAAHMELPQPLTGTRPPARQPQMASSISHCPGAHEVLNIPFSREIGWRNWP